MSGEWLDEVCFGFNEYEMERLGNAVKEHNPLFGQMILDMIEPMHTLSYWQSGDCDQAKHAKAWKEFSDKWLNTETPIAEVKENIMAEIEKKVNTMLGIPMERVY